MSSHEEQGRAPLHYCIYIRFHSAYFSVGDNIREICVHDKTDTQQTPSFVSGRSLLLSGFDPNHPAADSMLHEMGCPACLIVEGKKRFSNCGIEGEQILLLLPEGANASCSWRTPSAEYKRPRDGVVSGVLFPTFLCTNHNVQVKIYRTVGIGSCYLTCSGGLLEMTFTSKPRSDIYQFIGYTFDFLTILILGSMTRPVLYIFELSLSRIHLLCQPPDIYREYKTILNIKTIEL